MMSNSNNGGPAFPQHGWSHDPETIARMQQNGGMSLRDYFAGQAMVALGGGDYRSLHTLASDCYAIADAMLKVRELGS